MRGAGSRSAALLALAALCGIASADPEPATALASLEGIVRLAGVPSPARIEVRRISAPPGLPAFKWAWSDFASSDDPTDPGVVQAPVVATTASDESGAYRVEGLTAGRYQLTATAGSAAAFACVAVEGARAFVRDIAVVPGKRALHGRVRSADGQPFRGTVVVSQPREGRTATPWLDGAVAVETTGEGRFDVSGLVSGRIDVAAVVRGRLRVTWTSVEAADSADVEFVLDRGLAEATGRVTTPTGDPIANVPVVCRTVLDGGTEIAASTRADAGGRFRVLAAPGVRRVTVSAPGFLPNVSVDAGGEIVVRALRAPVVRGIVRSKDGGKPIEGAWVHVLVREGWGWRGTGGRTDALGRYEVASPSVGEAHVVVQGGGWVAVDPATETRMLDAESVTEVDFDAMAAARVLGRVMSEDGTPVAGARLDVRVREEGRERSRKEAALEPLATPATDRDGRFVLEGLLAGTPVTISARSPRHFRGRADTTAGETATITLRHRPPITGRIVLPPGARPSTVWLGAEPARAGGGTDAPPSAPESPPLSSLDVRSDGSFRIEPEGDGPYDLRARAWAAGVAYEGTAVGTPAKGDVLVPLQPARRDVRGWLFRVLDPDGHPVPDGGATIDDAGPGYSGTKWLPIRDGEVAYWSERPDTQVCVTVTDFQDAAGRPLPYAVTSLDAASPGVHSIRLRPGRTIRGRLRTPDGTPVPHAEIAAYPSAMPPDEHRTDAWAETDVEGRFLLTNLQRRGYDVAVSPPPGMSPVAPTPAPEGADDLEITILPLVRVRIDVRSSEDVPVAGARVSIWSTSGKDALATGALDLRTDATGSVVVPPLPPEQRYAMRIEPPGEDALAVDRDGWSPTATVVRLARADILRGVVLDSAKKPVAEATVWFRPSDGSAGGPSPERAWWRIRDSYVLGAVSGADGAFSIGRLIPGDVELFAAAAVEDGAVREGASVKASTSSREVVLTVPAR